jgi:hypothetical protein
MGRRCTRIRPPVALDEQGPPLDRLLEVEPPGMVVHQGSDPPSW